MKRDSYLRRFANLKQQALYEVAKSHTKHHRAFCNKRHHHGTQFLDRNHESGSCCFRLSGHDDVKPLSYVRYQQPQQGVQIVERQSSR